MHTIYANMVWGHSYEKFSTQKFTIQKFNAHNTKFPDVASYMAPAAQRDRGPGFPIVIWELIYGLLCD